MKKFILFSFLFLSACKVGPDYIEPSFEESEEWANAPKRSQKKKDIWKEIYWWENYRDPLLTQLVREALTSNYDLKKAFVRICQARAHLLEAEASLAPQVNATGNYIRGTLTPRLSLEPILPPLLNEINFNRDFNFNLFRAGLTASWEIDLFGRLRRRIDAAEAGVEAQIEDMHGTLLSLIAEVAFNYINLRNYQQQLKITQESLTAWNSICELNQSLWRAGFLTGIDVETAKASRDQTEASLFPLKANIQTTLHQLAVLIGKHPSHLYSLLSKPKPIPEIPSEIFANLPSKVLKCRPDMRAAERRLAGSTAEIGVAEGRLFPVFSLTGAVNRSYFSTNLFSLPTDLTLRNGFYSFGPGFSWPIADFGRIRADINASIATRDEHFYHYKSTLLKALADVENALVNYSSESHHYHGLKNSYKASQKAAQASLMRYKAGLVNFISVLQTQLMAQKDALTMVQSQAILALNSVALYKALGGGWQIDQTSWDAATLE